MYSFRPFNSNATYYEADTLTQVKHNIRQHAPSSTKYKAVATGMGKWAILSLSPYTFGPELIGYLAEDILGI